MAIELRIPRLGWSMEEGRFLGWRKQDGDSVRVGDVLYELEGEKAIQEVEAVDDGILRIPSDAPAADTLLPVGALLGYVTEPGEPPPWEITLQPAAEAVLNPDDKDSRDRSRPLVGPPASPAMRRLARERGVSAAEIVGSGPAGRLLPADVVAADTPAPNAGPGPARATSPASRSLRPVATPRARRIARDLAVDWTRIQGTGPKGRIREADVHAAARSATHRPRGTQQEAPSGRSVAITSRRRTIARRMVSSLQQTAPVTLTTRVAADALLAVRNDFKALGEPTAVPAITDVVALLVARTLIEHPLLAGRWEEERIVIPMDDGFHIGIAVDTPDGLLVPVIRNVPAKSLAEIAAESRDLVSRARRAALTAQEVEGGVLTITNLGAFGIDAFTPIINWPESSILGIGAIRREPTIGALGQFEVRQQLTLSLTFDHRVVDGAPAARFLADVCRAIENPSGLLAAAAG